MSKVGMTSKCQCARKIFDAGVTGFYPAISMYDDNFAKLNSALSNVVTTDPMELCEIFNKIDLILKTNDHIETCPLTLSTYEREGEKIVKTTIREPPILKPMHTVIKRWDELKKKKESCTRCKEFMVRVGEAMVDEYKNTPYTAKKPPGNPVYMIYNDILDHVEDPGTTKPYPDIKFEGRTILRVFLSGAPDHADDCIWKKHAVVPVLPVVDHDLAIQQATRKRQPKKTPVIECETCNKSGWNTDFDIKKQDQFKETPASGHSEGCVLRKLLPEQFVLAGNICHNYIKQFNRRVCHECSKAVSTKCTQLNDFIRNGYWVKAFTQFDHLEKFVGGLVALQKTEDLIFSDPSLTLFNRRSVSKSFGNPSNHNIRCGHSAFYKILGSVKASKKPGILPIIQCALHLLPNDKSEWAELKDANASKILNSMPSLNLEREEGEILYAFLIGFKVNSGERPLCDACTKMIVRARAAALVIRHLKDHEKNNNAYRNVSEILQKSDMTREQLIDALVAWPYYYIDDMEKHQYTTDGCIFNEKNIEDFKAMKKPEEWTSAIRETRSSDDFRHILSKRVASLADPVDSTKKAAPPAPRVDSTIESQSKVRVDNSGAVTELILLADLHIRIQINTV
jgi:hypothetical protein